MSYDVFIVSYVKIIVEFKSMKISRFSQTIYVIIHHSIDSQKSSITTDYATQQIKIFWNFTRTKINDSRSIFYSELDTVFRFLKLALFVISTFSRRGVSRDASKSAVF
jgi:tRNA threonylcarbamoyladenosine modification (KEOPS) complex  Pcc1 subunit